MNLVDILLLVTLIPGILFSQDIQGPNREAANTTEEVSHEKRLIHSLLLRYRNVGLRGRPVKNASDPVKVYFGLGLIRLEVQEKDNMILCSVWSRYNWQDEYLHWNPQDFGNITAVKLTTEDVWTPDIMLYNTASTERLERRALLVVSHDGMVRWFPHRIYHISCSINVRSFPFDNQTCHMWFGSWTHNQREIQLFKAFPEGIDLSTFNSDFKEACKWSIVEVTAIRLNGDNDEEFSVLSFSLHMRRRLMFSSYILTFPAVLLSFLTLLVFWLPEGASDKSSLGLTIFSGLLLLLLILVEAAPPTSSGVPVLGLYYCFNIVIVMLSVFLSSIVVNVSTASSHTRVPKILRIIFFDIIGRILGMSPRRQAIKRSISEAASKLQETMQQEDAWSSRTESLADKISKLRDSKHLDLDNGNIMVGLLEGRKENQTLKELIVLLREYVLKKKQDEDLKKASESIASEWRHLSSVLDRLFFWCYLVAIILSLVFLFPRYE